LEFEKNNLIILSILISEFEMKTFLINKKNKMENIYKIINEKELQLLFVMKNIKL
jgi:hypothetical protein